MPPLALSDVELVVLPLLPLVLPLSVVPELDPEVEPLPVVPEALPLPVSVLPDPLPVAPEVPEVPLVPLVPLVSELLPVPLVPLVPLGMLALLPGEVVVSELEDPVPDDEVPLPVVPEVLPGEGADGSLLPELEPLPVPWATAQPPATVMQAAVTIAKCLSFLLIPVLLFH